MAAVLIPAGGWGGQRAEAPCWLCWRASEFTMAAAPPIGHHGKAQLFSAAARRRLFSGHE